MFMDYFCVKSWETARLARACALLLGLVLLSACSTSSPVASQPKFTEADAADFIARYYSDQTSYVLKPVMMEGPYQSICDRSALLKLAREQPGRELAVIMLVHYQSADAEEPVKLAWAKDLAGLGYRRVVFLRSGGNMQANGLTMLESPHAPASFAGK
jgi:hypothetical protein